MPLGRTPAPFDHRDWIFEIKYDGFRALAFINDRCRFVSRKGTIYKSFPTLAADLERAVQRPAILDGEIVSLDADGKPQFYNLLRRRGDLYFAAFDVLWSGGPGSKRLPDRAQGIAESDSVRTEPTRCTSSTGVPKAFGVEAASRMDFTPLVAKLAVGGEQPGRDRARTPDSVNRIIVDRHQVLRRCTQKC